MRRKITCCIGGWHLIALAAPTSALVGCSTLLAVRAQQERAALNAVVSGTVSADHETRGPLVVGIVARSASGDFYLVDHFVTEKPGPWVFAVAPGTYWIVAFEDANHDGHYNDEPALRPEPEEQIMLTPGQRLQDVHLNIPAGGRFVRKSFGLADIRARDPTDQERVSAFALSVAGQVTTLDDPRFTREVADTGLWKYYDFLVDGKLGIYFLQDYDATKIPVLFIHGIGGTPLDFAALIASLDRTRFQPWVFYYPSGAYLDGSATLLTQLFVRLRVQYGFDQAVVVAHSMGGLIARQFVLQDYETNGTKTVRTFVTIASPLGGIESAGEGVASSPIVVPAWHGLAPGSRFIDALFYSDADRTQRRRLPAHVKYHLFFGFRGRKSSDGVVALSSQLRSEAQEEARSERGFNEGHRTILKSAAVAARLNEILAESR